MLAEAPAAPDQAVAAAATVNMRLRNDDVGIDARWATLPGSHPINAVIEQTVRDAVSARSAATGVAYYPQTFAAGAGLGARGCEAGATTTPAADVLAGRSGVVIVCEIVVARGSLFAENIRVVSGDAGVVASDVTNTFYSDLATGVTGTGSELIADPAPLWIAAVDTLRRHLGSLSLAPVEVPGEEQLAAFTTALQYAAVVGDELVIPIPADLQAAELDGLVQWATDAAARPQFVALPMTTAAASFTPLGAVVASASGEYLGPPARGVGFEPMPCDLVPCMAMTLDDGPSSLTPGFLDVLRDEQSAASFYMLGRNAQGYPDTVARVAAEGHEVGNHTWDHPYLTELTDAQVQAQLGDTRALLQGLSGQPVSTFRPPGGYIDDHVLELAGQPAIMWSVDTRDWAGPDDESLARYTIDTPKRGSIVLMHDIQQGSARVFGQVVAGLRDRGLVLVTIDELFGGSVPAGMVRHGPI